MMPATQLARSFTATLLVTLWLVPSSVQAGYIDFDPVMPGIQSASWPEPSKITIYIPAGIAGADRMNFEMGINSWIECLARITVNFVGGMRPAGEMGSVGVVLVAPGTLPGGRLGEAEPEAFFPAGAIKGNITGGTIRIDMGALGNANLMKNLGAHEFGHILGLDDKPRAAGPRVRVMDPDFTPADPFLPPSDEDKMQLAQCYTLIPEPSTFTLLGIGIFGLLGCSWRCWKRAG